MEDELLSAPEITFSATTIPGDHTDPKTDVLSLDEFKPDALQYENPALVLDQLLPIDMSSPTLLINQTPTSDKHVANYDHSDSTAIDRLLDELDFRQDEVVKPFVEVEQLEDIINPFSDAANVTSPVFSVSKNDAHQSFPVMEQDLLQVGDGSVHDSLLDSLDNQHPSPEPQKPDDHMPEKIHENDNIIIAEIDPFPKTDLVTENETFQIPAAELPKPQHTPMPESPREKDDINIANSDSFPNSADNSEFNGGSDSPKYVQDSFGNRVLVDTSAPIDSVKDAVSKFGGIVDWKAHKVQTGERRRFIEQELEKAQEEVPIFRKMSDKAEEEKSEVLQELEAAKRLIEDMKLNVERAQTEEHQARQDSELVKLRVEELEQGVAEESSVAAKAQVEVAKARQAAAVSDLQSANEELESLKRDYTELMLEKETATEKAEQAMAEAKEVEKTVQDLTIELISTKEALESAHAVHLEAEERRVTAAIDRDQSAEKWGKELKEVQDEVTLLDEQVTAANDLQSKLNAATLLLEELKAELANYMESKTIDNADGLETEKPKSLRRTHTGIQASVASAKMELDDVRANIDKAIEEVEALKVAASALQSELETEKKELENFKHIKDGTKAESVKAIEVEVSKIEFELAETKVRETLARQKMMDLTMQLPQAAQEADRVKSEAEEARDELTKAKDEAEQVKSEAIRMESRVVSAEKETEAAKASEKLALGAIQALRESDNAEEPSSSEVTVSVEEYYELGKKAHEAEEDANARVGMAEAQVEEAKEAQMKSMEKLEEVDQEVGQRREELNMALKRAEEAAEGKLRLEEQLRQWRSRCDEEKINSESKAEIKAKSHESSNYIRIPTAHYTSPPPMTETVAEGEKATKKKKKSFFPRILMFMARRKTQSSKH